MARFDLQPHAYVLAVRDLPGTARYFVDALGFEIEWEDGDDWTGLVRDGVRLRLGHCPDAIAPAELGDHSYFAYITTSDIDVLYEVFAQAGAIVRSPPKDQPWGWREMAVGTPEGHRIMFAQPV